MNELLEILFFCVYLLWIWAGGFIFNFLYVGPIGQVLAGMVLSDQLLAAIPFQDALVLAGKIGLMMVIFEGGLHCNFGHMRIVGRRAFLAAITGVIFPIALGYAMLIPLDYTPIQALVAGTSLASTSIGMCLALLGQKKQLDTSIGQFISTAAMVDDIISLIILSVLSNVTKRNVYPGDYAEAILRPTLVSVFAIGIAVGCSFLFPFVGRVLTCFERRLESRREQVELSHSSPRAGRSENAGDSILIASDENPEIHVSSSSSTPVDLSSPTSTATLLCMLLWGFGLSIAVGEAGSTYLLGSYAAGLSFSSIPFAHKLWEQRVSPISSWLSTIFFSSIGFLIPIKHMFDASAFKFGLLFAVLQVIGKLICGLFAFDIRADGWTIGWGMVARGELGFVLASKALESGSIPPDLFVIIVWALFLTTLFAPFPFSFCLSRRHEVA